MQREKVKEKVKENEDFFDYKNILLKMPQICILANGLVLAICFKNWDFPCFVFMENASRKSV